MKYTFSQDKQKLILTVDDAERAALRGLDDVQSDQAMHDFFDSFIGNSEFQFCDASQTGDLTAAPMLAICDEHGQPFARWAFMAYEVQSVLEALRDTGQAVFDGGALVCGAVFNRFEIEMPLEIASDCSHAGDCASDVDFWQAQVTRPATCTPERLRAELAEYGAWSGDELSDDSQNWRRIVWLAAGNITEERRQLCRA